MIDFLYMGGHWFFVWASYGVSVAVLALMFWLPVLRLRRLLHNLPNNRDLNS